MAQEDKTETNER